MKLECSHFPLPFLSLSLSLPPLAADCKSFRHRTNHVKEGSNKIGLTEGGGGSGETCFRLLLFPIGAAEGRNRPGFKSRLYRLLLPLPASACLPRSSPSSSFFRGCLRHKTRNVCDFPLHKFIPLLLRGAGGRARWRRRCCCSLQGASCGRAVVVDSFAGAAADLVCRSPMKRKEGNIRFTPICSAGSIERRSTLPRWPCARLSSACLPNLLPSFFLPSFFVSTRFWSAKVVQKLSLNCCRGEEK